jgi:ankyrin repeat protein
MDKWWTLRLDGVVDFREQLRSNFLSRPRARWRGLRDIRDESLRIKSRMFVMQCNATLLHIFVDCGFANLVQRELNSYATEISPSTWNYVNASCGLLGTALHIAVHHGDTRIIHLLLAAGADTNVQSKSLRTPKEYAASLKDIRTLHALRERRTSDTSNDTSATDRATAERLRVRAAALLYRSKRRRSALAISMDANRQTG